MDACGGELLRRSSSYRKLMEKVVLRILSNINNGVSLGDWVIVDGLLHV